MGQATFSLSRLAVWLRSIPFLMVTQGGTRDSQRGPRVGVSISHGYQHALCSWLVQGEGFPSSMGGPAKNALPVGLSPAPLSHCSPSLAGRLHLL